MVRGRYSFEEMERLFTSCIGETATAEKLQAEPCVRTAGHSVGKGGHECSPKGPSREETRAMDRILKEPSRQTEQPSFFFFFLYSFSIGF